MTYNGQLGILFTKPACFYLYDYLAISFTETPKYGEGAYDRSSILGD